MDVFHPDLIAANKRYARDLLTHVNAYTKARYADEPAVAMVEINNEDTIFLWGGEAEPGQPARAVRRDAPEAVEPVAGKTVRHAREAGAAWAVRRRRAAGGGI